MLPEPRASAYRSSPGPDHLARVAWNLDQLGALGLVVNIIILWNTLYINAALEQLASQGYAIQTEDIARLSPLVFEHINLLGRYAFSVPDSVVRGQLRSLRNPADALENIA